MLSLLTLLIGTFTAIADQMYFKYKIMMHLFINNYSKRGKKLLVLNLIKIVLECKLHAKLGVSNNGLK